MIIAIDIDDVLCPTLEAANAWFNKREGVNHSIDEYTHMRYDIIWKQYGYTDSELFPLFLESEEFHNLKAWPDAVKAIKKLKLKHELHIITGRLLVLEEVTKKWLNKYFGNVFTSINMINHNWSLAAGEKQQLTKLEVCQKLRAQLIIEDNPVFGVECASGGISCILHDRPWNRNPETRNHKKIYMAKDWDEVEKIIGKLK